MRQETNDWSWKFTTSRWGRPAKLNDKFLQAFQNLIFRRDKRSGDLIVTAKVLLEDNELVEFINLWLEPSEQVSYDSFLSWKKDAKRFASGDDQDLPNNKIIDDVTFARFYQLYRGALLAFKMKILEEIADNFDPSWRWKAWILERKFKEWNISWDMEWLEWQKVLKKFIFEEQEIWAIQ